MKPNILKRVLQEVEEANADFFNLRTVISLDLDHDVTRFYFMMMPNDGAMAHLTLVGIFYIPDTYPDSPPIVQLYTPTRRYNVDVYRCALARETLQSTMCFDILRSEANGGTWKPEYTLSSLFASLMSAIVSFYVAQQYGCDLPEYVSMKKLHGVKEDAKNIYEQHKSHLPEVPKLPLVEATMVPAKSLFKPQELIVGCPETVTSEAIFLQTGSGEVHSFAVDLSGLHSDVVFSVILSNSDKPTDLTGNESGTILVRNGVTATAARKLANQETVWFYHGKPMNDGDMRLHVTIGRDQMTFAYYEDGRLYVHGDCPVSRLSVEHIGDVKDVPFYVHIYMKDKSLKPPKPPQEAKPSVLKPTPKSTDNKRTRKEARKKQVHLRTMSEEAYEQLLLETSNAKKRAEAEARANAAEEEAKAAALVYNSRVIVPILDIDGKGYIHESVGEDERNDFGFELIQHSETVAEQEVETSAMQRHGLSRDLEGLKIE